MGRQLRIGIWNLEPKYRNYALDKAKHYHSMLGDYIEDNMFMGLNGCDIVYCSAIFSWTPFSKKYKGLPYPLVQTGGTGFDLTVKMPPEIENDEPHLNYGFTTRGCIRKCEFCFVPRKEGELKIVNDLTDLYDDRKGDEVTLLDNNILAAPEHFAAICKQARDRKIKVDFNQGLDHRLLTPEIVDILCSIRHREYRFAFDHPAYSKSVEKALRLLQRKGIKRCNWYVLVGYDTTLKQDLFRLNYLRENNQIAFVQRYRGIIKPKIERDNLELTALARWANQHHIYRGMTWEQFLKHPDNKRYKYLLSSPNKGELQE